MATAFIYNGQDLLMMKRSMNKKIAPGMYSGVGGHIEPYEHNHPRNACLREVFEETGLAEEQLTDFRLQYVILRQYQDEIRQQFVYFGVSETKDVLQQTNEGELKWVNGPKVFNLNLTVTTYFILKHHFGNGCKNNILVGVVSPSNDNPIIEWSNLNAGENPVQIEP
jgi:8-oxo-dGTP diphosphatase